jgi:ferric-dicitrate binding protein FerR (iron transport regulator)
MDNSSIQLLDRYLSGECSEEERQRVEAWLEQMELSQNEWTALDATAKAEWLAKLYGDIQHTIAKPTRRLFIFRFAAAAILILLAGTGAWLWLRPSGENNKQVAAKKSTQNSDALPGHDGAILTLADHRQVVLDSLHDGTVTTQGSTTVLIKNGQLAYAGKGQELLYNTLTTPRGRQYQFVLPDGSRVWLDAASSITYPTSFTDNKRRVTITGEAYFEIAKDQSKPFYINFNGMEVEVLGTSVNIDAYPGEAAIKTTLLSGSVRVKANKAVILKPGEQAGLSEATNTLQVRQHINLDEVMAWKNGYFQFNDADIQTVMRQLERWYDLEVVYEGPVPRDRFGGKLPRDANASEVLKALEQTQVHFRIEGKKLIVMP